MKYHFEGVINLVLLLKIGSTTVETHTTQNEQTDQDKQVNPSTDESNAVQNSTEKSMPHDESECVSIDKPDEATDKIQC